MSAVKEHDTAEPVRVCLIGCTGLLGDIVLDALRRDPRITVVARVDSAAELGNPADSAPPLDELDLVVWNCADESRVPEWLDGVRSTPRVLAVVEDGRAAALWELAPRRTALGSLSPLLLAEVIRTGALHTSSGRTEFRTETQELP
ncbi:hypothetical protein [Blastococcus saxobsidens]|uniref:Uncharacterized protein n=1 Tax=Blastococcus saxobsidens (strain DD2) TaxID=1146883 RepID=H6RQ76_BLASD|nr:hypothetical protein [Blastococcus saxobsidens]CCG04043.1 protein of unknown function; putative NAD(P)-binding Rossmann-fold domain [Blastococcus saxobsidens DD2]